MILFQASEQYKAMVNKNRLSSTSSKDSGHNSGQGSIGGHSGQGSLGSIDRSSTGSGTSQSSHGVTPEENNFKYAAFYDLSIY